MTEKINDYDRPLLDYFSEDEVHEILKSEREAGIPIGMLDRPMACEIKHPKDFTDEDKKAVAKVKERIAKRKLQEKK